MISLSEIRRVRQDGIYQPVIENNLTIGCVMAGDIKNFNTITGYITEKREIGTLKNSLS